MVQYAAVRQILYVFCAYRLVLEESHHRRQRDLIFYKLATLRIHTFSDNVLDCSSCFRLLILV